MDRVLLCPACMQRVWSLLGTLVLVAMAMTAEARPGGFGSRKVTTALGRTNALEMTHERDGRGQSGALRWHTLRRGKKGGVEFDRLEFETPYGRTQVVEVNGELQHCLKIGKETYLVDRRKDGTIVYRNAAGKLFNEHQVLRTASGRRQTRLGAAKVVKTALGTEEVVVRGDWVHRVIPGKKKGEDDFEGAAIKTPYGTSSVVEVDGELRNQIEIGGETFLVARRKDGEVVFRDARGKLYPPGARLRTLDGRRLTQAGPTFRVETATGTREMVDTHEYRGIKTVTWRAGREPKLSTATFETPYGDTKIVERDGVFRHELHIGDEVYLVDKRPDGQVVYRDARGRFVGPGRELRSADGRRQTRYGPVTKLMTATGPIEGVRDGRGDWLIVGPMVDGKIKTEKLGGYSDYGVAKVVERRGQRRVELKIGKQRYLWGHDAEGHRVLRDGRGRLFREKDLVSSDGRPQTPYGPAEEVMTASGPRFFVVERNGYDYSTRKRRDILHWVFPGAEYASARTKAADLETPYGTARIVGPAGKRRLELRIDAETYLVDFTKHGYLLRDRTGKEFRPGDTLRTPDGRLQTRWGTSEPMATATGTVEVIRYTKKSETKGKRGKTTYYTVTADKDGELTFEKAGFETMGGTAKVERVNGRLQLVVKERGKARGKTYLAGRRADGRVAFLLPSGAVVDQLPEQRARDRAPRLRSLFRRGLPELPAEQTAQIGNSTHGSQQEYEELRDGVIDILRRYPPSEYVYVGVGRSPSALFAILENLQGPGGGPLAMLFPASGLRGGQPDSYYDAYAQHFRALLPPQVRYGKRRILLVDRSNPGSGDSIVNLEGMLKAYLRDIGSDTRVEGVGLSSAPLGHGLDHIDTTGRKVLQALSSSKYEEIAKYPSHTIGRERLSSLKERPQYGEFRRLMGERMKRDPVLHEVVKQLSAAE